MLKDALHPGEQALLIFGRKCLCICHVGVRKRDGQGVRLSALTRLVIVHEFSEVHLGVRLGPVKRQVSGRGFPHNELLFPHIPLYTGVSAGEAVFLLQPAMDTCGRVPLLPWSPAVLFKPLVDDRDVFPEHRISLSLNIWQVVRAPVLLVCVLLNSLKAMLCDARNFPQTFSSFS